jgi:hypothetical protein
VFIVPGMRPPPQCKRDRVNEMLSYDGDRWSGINQLLCSGIPRYDRVQFATSVRSPCKPEDSVSILARVEALCISNPRTRPVSYRSQRTDLPPILSPRRRLKRVT